MFDKYNQQNLIVDFSWGFFTIPDFTKRWVAKSINKYAKETDYVSRSTTFSRLLLLFKHP